MDARGLGMVTVIATSFPLALALAVIHWQVNQSRMLKAQDAVDDVASKLPAERQRRRIEERSDKIQWLTVQMLIFGMAAWVAVVASQIPWTALRLSWIDGAILLLAVGWAGTGSPGRAARRRPPAYPSTPSCAAGAAR